MSTTSSGLKDRVATDLENHFEVTRCLNREARLRDERRYSDWLGLLAADVEYCVPIRRFRAAAGPDEDWDVSKELSAEGDLQMTIGRLPDLQLRVGRLLSGKAHTENPPWFTQRLVTNVEVGSSETPDHLEVESKFLLNRFKSGREQTIVGSRSDVLVRAEGELRISRRRVLYNADAYRWGAYVLI